MFPDTSSTTEFIYNTKLADKEAALTAAVEYGFKQGWQLVAVLWEKEEANEHHFKILYDPK
jgi:hypothetical protein